VRRVIHGDERDAGMRDERDADAPRLVPRRSTPAHDLFDQYVNYTT
jgi:hypothetical protein